MSRPNLPNTLTILRIVLVPVVVIALLDETTGGDIVAAAVFAMAAITDGVDGYLARARDLVTTFGKIMDPIADKMLVAATLVSLVSLDRMAVWVAIVVIAREFAVSGLRMLHSEQGRVISASPWGKLKTVVQIAVVLIVITFEPAPWIDLLVYAMVVVTVASGIDYFVNVNRRVDPVESQATRAS